jgi:REP element-mobilizing transposase RayT
VNAKRRWLAPWAGSATKPAIYHCLSRVVDRRLALDVGEKERFRQIMRKVEGFSGCRVLSYCVMSNHFHLLLEVPPMPAGGLSDGELLRRLGALYSRKEVNEVARELKKARARLDAPDGPGDGAAGVAGTETGPAAAGAARVAGAAGDDAAGVAVAAGAEETGGAQVRARAAARVAAIHARYTYRMHDLSQFMKTLLQRFTRWFNRVHERRGTLWEERFKSVIVESGVAARTVAAYIDLNPVRAGVAADPADYRWSGYGEAVGAGPRGDGQKAREGLVRACLGHEGAGFEAERWAGEVSRIYRWAMGLALGRKRGGAEVDKGRVRPGRSRAEALAGEDNGTVLPDLGIAAMLLRRVRYFSDGVAIGGREFVNEVFAGARHRFTAGRKDGARKLRGGAAPAAGLLWSARDLRVRI